MITNEIGKKESLIGKSRRTKNNIADTSSIITIDYSAFNKYIYNTILIKVTFKKRVHELTPNKEGNRAHLGIKFIKILK